MTNLGVAVWIASALVLISATRFLARPVSGFGGFIVYRRGGAGELIARSSHARCRTAPRAAVPSFDGVIVPSARVSGNLLRAVRTARNAGAPLVVLTSGRADAIEAERLLGNWPGLVLNTWEHLPRPALRTFRHPCAATTSDVSSKRNTGLVIARMLGWRTVLFLDDDVQVIAPGELTRAAALLAGHDRGGVPRRLVGWAFEKFRDFSVVGHACSYGIDEPVSFAGGGATAMTCDPAPPFFPPVYNEDLLVELNLVREDPHALCVVGTLEQDSYSPFSDAERAVAQEFGEALAEGWRRNPGEADLVRPEFWRSVLRGRQALIATAEKKLIHHGKLDGVDAVRAARRAHQKNWPELLASFAGDWKLDTATWIDFLNSLPRVEDFGLLRPATAAGPTELTRAGAGVSGGSAQRTV